MPRATSEKRLPLLLTVKDAAELLNLSVAYVENLVASGELRSVKIGRARRVERAELERFISAHACGGAA